jgi:hypothetical protein
MPSLRAGLLLAIVLCAGAAGAEFRHEGDISLRYDDRSSRPAREQYRLRWSPGYAFGEQWSVHAYVATGAAFPSA